MEEELRPRRKGGRDKALQMGPWGAKAGAGMMWVRSEVKVGPAAGE